MSLQTQRALRNQPSAASEAATLARYRIAGSLVRSLGASTFAGASIGGPEMPLWMAAGERVFYSELLSRGHVHISVLGRNAYPVPARAFGLIERFVRRLK